MWMNYLPFFRKFPLLVEGSLPKLIAKKLRRARSCSLAKFKCEIKAYENMNKIKVAYWGIKVKSI